MSVGQGNIVVQSKKEAGGGGTLTGAQNGLSLNGTIVELGGILIHDTLINVDSFGFSITEGIQPLFIIENTTGDITLGEFTVGTKTNLELLKGSTAAIRSAGQTLLLLDGVNGLSQIGDISGTGNGMQVKINDTGETIELGDPDAITNETVLRIQNAGKLSFESNGNDFLVIDSQNGSYYFGDINAVGNQTSLIITDNIELAQISSGGFSRLALDSLNGSYQLGPSGTATPAYFEINENLGVFQTVYGTGSNGLYIDAINADYILGDLSVVGNGSRILLSDSLNTLFLNNSSNTLGIDINGVAGFTGTVTPVTTITVNNGIVTNVA